MASVSLKNIYKSFGKVEVIKDVDLEIESGEFVVFVGPSGCGKSTLLRLICGLEEITSGELDIGGENVNSLSPRERGIAMVFQSYALYPHMTVYKNMAFGLKTAGEDKEKIKQKILDAAKVLQLDQLLDRRPAELSGGQRQRVAIGRAIVREPRVFLFDEPLSNLDASLRIQMRIEISRLHESLDCTTIYVTHDQVEAMTLADKIVVLSDGKVEQVGTPMSLYNEPANLFVAKFIGAPAMNFIQTHRSSALKQSESCYVKADIAGESVLLPCLSCCNSEEEQMLTIGIRPEHINVLAEDETIEVVEDDLKITVVVDLVERLGDVSYLYTHMEGGNPIAVTVSGQSLIKVDEQIELHIPANKIHLFNEAGERISASCE